MGRYVGPVCKLCRREGEKLFLKGSKCMTTKCPFERRGFAPGQHGQGRRTRLSDYGIQLREKQKIKRIYGLFEKQFRNYYKKADRMKGITGSNLILLLESRLDNVVFRLGFAPSRKAARQLVTHRHFNVNGKIVNVPSYITREGDVIEVRDKAKKMEVIHASMRRVKTDNGITWLELDKASMQGKVIQIPEREQIPLNVREQLVVELYSK
ncbi:MAG: 30S ribosomal protein S4 [Candidatus Marinimicrobia bacterium]|nr:30S ribosomal protein S4 [Candidatus Neomarinimicrobiota bacterium]MCH7619829.1 30S ribosomal protein S4 [Candidatus Neomarinimicrobiota bacterium]MCH8288149.1 30S ribosomal protein S4 [Candidatus Neomarinimicrobiota bacterium]